MQIPVKLEILCNLSFIYTIFSENKSMVFIGYSVIIHIGTGNILKEIKKELIFIIDGRIGFFVVDDVDGNNLCNSSR